EPPWRARLMVPDRASTCRFTAVARTTSGARASDTVETRRIVLEDRVEVALREVYVSVSARGLHAVPELRPEDFRVVDGGVEESVSSLSRGDTPISALLLIDASESVRGELPAEFAAARTFLAG